MDAPAPASAPPNEPRVERDRLPQTQACPGCGHEMPALKGARLSICPMCGYKESCCY